MKGAERTAFRAALGTLAPTSWIAPSTFLLALDHFPPLNLDRHVDPDVVVVDSNQNRLIFQIRWRSEETALLMDEAQTAPIIDPTQPRFLDLGERQTGGESGQLPAAVEAPAEKSLPPAAEVARELRRLSGLSARQLGAIFPIARENYQRWMSGALTPSAANLQRLLALRHFVRELTNRVESSKLWLLEPISAGGSTPHELLCRGDLRTLWDAVSHLPVAIPSEIVVDAKGDHGVSIASSLRGGEQHLSEEEIDDYSEWLDDD